MGKIFDIMKMQINQSFGIIFTLLCLISITPVLFFKYIPLADLPNHILAAALHSGALDSVENNVLSAHWLPSPYILFHTLMYPLVKLFGYMMAAKIILIFYILLLPLSVLWFTIQFSPDKKYLAFFAFVFIYNYHFDYGFIPYCLGVPFVFIGLGLIYKGLKNGFSIRILLLSSLITSIIYLSHFDNFFAYMIGVLLLFCFNKKLVQNAMIKTPHHYLKLFFKFLVIATPTLILLFIYYSYLLANENTTIGNLSIIKYASLYRQLIGCITFFFSYDFLVDGVKLLLLLLMLLWLLTRRSIQFEKGFLFYFGIIMLFLPFLIPRWRFFSGWDHSSRMTIFGILSLMMSFNINKASARKLIVLVVSLIVIASIGVRTFRYGKINNIIHTFVQDTSKHIPSGSNICTIYHAFPNFRIPPLLHVIAYFHLAHGGYSPFLFSDKAFVAGIESDVNLPRFTEHWYPGVMKRIPEILPHYDHLVVLTYGSELPKQLLKFSNGIVHQDSVCTIFKISKLKLTNEPSLNN